MVAVRNCLLSTLCISLYVGLPSAIAAPKANSQPSVPTLARADFNRLAYAQGIPLFWETDSNNNQRIDPAELTVIDGNRRRYVSKGAFSAAFTSAYKKLAEARRKESVALELRQGRPTLLISDYRKASSADRQLIKEIVAASKIIDQLYLRQIGAAYLVPRLRGADPAERALFARNNGPWCHTPKMRDDVFCNALPGFPQRRSDSYPTDGPQDRSLCDQLAKHRNAQQLLAPFTAVRRRGKELIALPYTKVFAAQMQRVATHLRRAAKVAEKSQPSEQALIRYLLAAAQAFTSNDWEPADQAWAAMSATNSRFYLRIAPDEVYEDLCQQKSLFHVSFAAIDQASLAWQKRLTPLREKMERALAAQIGAPYRAREVRFHMPDFIKIILNAGDSRHPLGATIGQSLPNWGKVAKEGRGRTVVMTNLYTDRDSEKISRAKAKRLLDPTAYSYYTDDRQPFLLNTILHEASHNFGPHSDYLVAGKAPKELFGGGLASTLEELKAQTGGLWFLQLLKKHGLIDETAVRQAYVNAVLWAFGHVSRGMHTASGSARPYSQLSAVQLGVMQQHGALVKKGGRYLIDFAKMPKAVDQMMRQVGQFKARGDKPGATKFIEAYIGKDALKRLGIDTIKREVLRHAKATFIYAIWL